MFLAHAAAQTTRIRLGTGIVTLPLEEPVRVAEDAAVFDLISGGRLELGLGSGGTPSAFAGFGRDSADRAGIFERHVTIVRDALAGRPLGGGNILYPAAPHLIDRIWQATFSVAGGARAGEAGDGLMLSRTQPRPKEAPHATLADLQHPIIDAYLDPPEGPIATHHGVPDPVRRDDRQEALRFADVGLRRNADRLVRAGHTLPGQSLADLVAAFDVHLGRPEDVLASLTADSILERATDIVFQVHSIDPPHPYILRSIELIAKEVAPALGWRGAHAAKDAALAP